MDLVSLFDKLNIDNEEDEIIVIKVLEEEMNELIKMYRIIYDNRDAVLYFSIKEKNLSRNVIKKIYEKIHLDEFYYYFIFYLRDVVFQKVEEDLVREIINLYREYYCNMLF